MNVCTSFLDWMLICEIHRREIRLPCLISRHHSALNLWARRDRTLRFLPVHRERPLGDQQPTHQQGAYNHHANDPAIHLQQLNLKLQARVEKADRGKYGKPEHPQQQQRSSLCASVSANYRRTARRPTGRRPSPG